MDRLVVTAERIEDQIGHLTEGLTELRVSAQQQAETAERQGRDIERLAETVARQAETTERQSRIVEQLLSDRQS